MDTIYRMDELPTRPGKYLPLDATQIAEGMASSAATAISRLGGGVSLLSSVGDDLTGTAALAAMAAEGVDCSPTKVTPGVPSATAAVLVDRSGERIIVPYYHPRLWDDPRLPDGLAQGDFGAVLVDVRWPDAAELALRSAALAGAFGVLDADVAALHILERLSPLASHIVASEPGARLLTGLADPAAAALALADRFGAMVVVTAGEKGSFWVDADRDRVTVTPAFEVEAVDTTAAGDVFHGAFALGLVEGMTGETLIRFASAAAAVKCTRFGGRLGAPTRAEVEAMLLRGAGQRSA